MKLDSFRKELVDQLALSEEGLSISKLDEIAITRNPKSNLKGDMSLVVVLRLRKDLSEYVKKEYSFDYPFTDQDKQQLYDLANDKILRERDDVKIPYEVVEKIKQLAKIVIVPSSNNLELYNKGGSSYKRQTLLLDLTGSVAYLMFSSGRRMNEMFDIERKDDVLYYTPSKSRDKTPKMFEVIDSKPKDWWLLYQKVRPFLDETTNLKSFNQRLNRFLKDMNLTSHQLRKIYATLIANQKGGNKTQRIKECLGHQNIASSVFYNQVEITMPPKIKGDDGKCILCGSRYDSRHCKTKRHLDALKQFHDE